MNFFDFNYIILLMFSQFGLIVINRVSNFGKFMLFSFNTIKSLFLFRYKFKLIIDQLIHLGIHSIPIVSLTAFFVGMAFGVQVIKELLKFGAPDIVGGVIAIAVWRELGPLITGVVVASRAGASITAEIGSMKVNEQVEALNVMGQDSTNYLVIPRVIAMAIMLPLLVGLADIIGFLGGLIIALSTSTISHVSFFTSANTMLNSFDILSGLIKAFIFSIVISLTANYLGLNVKYGAQDVGKMTRNSVVISIIVIFGLNYLLSFLFFTL